MMNKGGVSCRAGGQRIMWLSRGVWVVSIVV